MKPETVVWITGLPSSGKTSLGERLRSRFIEMGKPCALLDGDDVRDSLVPRPGYSPLERDAFYETLARLAALLARQGIVVIVAATSHRAIYRDRAYDGTASGLPGVAEQYEAPLNPEIVATGGFDDIAVERVMAAVA